MALPTEIRPDTLELILGLTKDVPERQLQDVTALDGKMMQLFSVGGVVIGLAGLSTITAATTSSGPVGPALLFGLLCFAALATVALLELTVRTYRRTPNGADLWSTHYLREANDVRHALVVDIAEACEQNQESIHQKACLVQAGLVLVALEILLVAFSLIWSRFF